MKYLANTWAWLSGKKTWAGLALAFLSGGLLAIGLIDEGSHKTVMAFATLIAGTGLAHKKAKGQL